jgi:hypothetical protein
MTKGKPPTVEECEQALAEAKPSRSDPLGMYAYVRGHRICRGSGNLDVLEMEDGEFEDYIRSSPHGSEYD